MKTVNLNLIGGFGNNLFQYCAMRGYCERHSYELRTTPWVGEQIFELNDPLADLTLPRWLEGDLLDSGVGDVSVEGYFQNQASLDFYTRKKAKEWLKFKNLGELNDPGAGGYLARHVRRGDYVRLGYPLVSEKSYNDCLEKYNLGAINEKVTASDANPYPTLLPKYISFLPDFINLKNAAVLLRANSTFSYWAHVLADDSQRVFSPRIDGLGAGEHDVAFEEGNHCKCSDFSFTTDLHLKP